MSIRKDLKGLAADFTEMLNDVLDIRDRVEQAIDEDIAKKSYNKHSYMCDQFDGSKPKLGKRGANVRAKIGGDILQRALGVDEAQACKVWNYLSSEAQNKFDELVVKYAVPYANDRGF